MAEAMLHTDAQRLDKLILHVYPCSDGSFTLYEDDGYTYAYEKGQYAKTCLTYTDAEKILTIAATEGGYAGMPWARSYEVVYHDADKPETVLVNGGAESAWRYDARSRVLGVTLAQMPVKECLVIQLIAGEVMETSVALQEASLRYDLEYLPETDNARMGCLIRMFGEKDDRVSLTIPVGWTCVSQKQETLATGHWTDSQQISAADGGQRIYRHRYGNTEAASGWEAAVGNGESAQRLGYLVEAGGCIPLWSGGL